MLWSCNKTPEAGPSVKERSGFELSVWTFKACQHEHLFHFPWEPSLVSSYVEWKKHMCLKEPTRWERKEGSWKVASTPDLLFQQLHSSSRQSRSCFALELIWAWWLLCYSELQFAIFNMYIETPTRDCPVDSRMYPKMNPITGAFFVLATLCHLFQEWYFWGWLSFDSVWKG